MIAIHSENTDFSKRWINYCKEKEIPYKIVNCYDNNIIEHLKDCKALFWHHNHRSFEDLLFAKQLLFALEHAGVKVFPDFKTGWHFDDKVAQKYLFEASGVPLVPSYVFYDKQQALEWAKNTTYPKVFKLRGGAGSSNVKLVKSYNENKKLIKKAFNKGFPALNKKGKILDAIKLYKEGSVPFINIFKAIYLMYVKPSYYSKMISNERGYVYFQDFIANNKTDFRIKVVDQKCWGFQRVVRKNDFRASGSGKLIFDNSKIPIEMIKIALETSQTLGLQSVAFDFVINNNQPLIVEISYCFGMDSSELNYGYWDQDLKFYKGSFNPFGWMIESVINKV